MDLVFAPSQIETWPIDRLRPYARNAKMHGDDQVAKIAASMAKFGWTVPCMVADDGELIAGLLAEEFDLALLGAGVTMTSTPSCGSQRRWAGMARWKAMTICLRWRSRRCRCRVASGSLGHTG